MANKNYVTSFFKSKRIFPNNECSILINYSVIKNTQNNKEAIQINIVGNDNPIGQFQWFYCDEDKSDLMLLSNQRKSSHLITVNDFNKNILVRFISEQMSARSPFLFIPAGSFGSEYFENLMSNIKNLLEKMMKTKKLRFFVFDKNQDLVILSIKSGIIKAKILLETNENSSSSDRQDKSVLWEIENKCRFYVECHPFKGKSFDIIDLESGKSYFKGKCKSMLERDSLVYILREKFGSEDKYLDYCKNPSFGNKTLLSNQKPIPENLKSIHRALLQSEVDYLLQRNNDIKSRNTKLFSENKKLLKTKNALQNKINSRSRLSTLKDKETFDLAIENVFEKTSLLRKNVEALNNEIKKALKNRCELIVSYKNNFEEFKVFEQTLEKQKSELNNYIAKRQLIERKISTFYRLREKEQNKMEQRQSCVESFKASAVLSRKLEKENFWLKSAFVELIFDRNFFNDTVLRIKKEPNAFISSTLKRRAIEKNAVVKERKESLDIASIPEFLDNFLDQKVLCEKALQKIKVNPKNCQFSEVNLNLKSIANKILAVISEQKRCSEKIAKKECKLEEARNRLIDLKTMENSTTETGKRAFEEEEEEFDSFGSFSIGGSEADSDVP